MHALSNEQVLIIADIFCERFNTHITDYAALTCISALSSAAIHSVPIFTTPQAYLDYIHLFIAQNPPLAHANEAFSEYLARIFVDLNDAT
ncbi:hypothetical protein [Corynebacterium sp. sy039]|uniref:hypothetical protein n=1 Tax=Corynebacterium sp. sy039 TaxID=2599641 RepID=UPI0011B42506|nr:hypothetical protein [Corynebacterium sp. sy039]QDZ41732.1 hypothetical protein FQV43_00035 [Corynebacterium sp. sy039]